MMKSLTKTLHEKFAIVSAEAWLIVLVVLMMILARSVMVGKMNEVHDTLRHGVWKLSDDNMIRFVGEDK